MTVQDFIASHPDETIELITSDGRVLLESPQLKRLQDHRPVIAVSDRGRPARFLQADDLLKQTVCSAIPIHGLWRLSAAADEWDKPAARYQPGSKKRRKYK